MASRQVVWLSPQDPPELFPPVSDALREPDGLLAAGGDLSERRLVGAYCRGIFPWYEEGQPILWWTPDPRCVFMPGDFRASRRLRRDQRRFQWQIRVDTAFDQVIAACAAPRRSEQGTWITDDMSLAYRNLHRLGWAHSIEVWLDDQLVGGLYGIAIGRAFFGESMFSHEANASKFALMYLAQRLLQGDLELLDCQMVSAHLLSLGATAIPRAEFVQTLQKATNVVEKFENWPKDPINCSELSQD